MLEFSAIYAVYVGISELQLQVTLNQTAKSHFCNLSLSKLQ